MKKLLLLPMLAMLSIVFFPSCNKDVAEEVKQETSLSARLANDKSFSDVVNSAVALYKSTSTDLLDNEVKINELKAIAVKINNKTATAEDKVRAEALLGVSFDEYVIKLKDYGVALASLDKKFPELKNMSNDTQSSLFADAMKQNTELNALMQPQMVNGRVVACPLRDICKLAVSLAAMFGGEALCTAIDVSTIPIIGGLLCRLIITLGTNILNGICMALPC